MKYLLIAISLLFVSCELQNDVTKSGSFQGHPKIPYGTPIPFKLGIHNDHSLKDSLKIEFIDKTNKALLIYKGNYSKWGMHWSDKEIKSGEYLLKLSWQEDSGPKQTTKQILINPEAKYFTLNIELANSTELGKAYNAIYLDQYLPSLENVKFSRKWNPVNQLTSDTILVPEYEVLNQHDSTIYGAYTRYSSMLSINWVQMHDIAFMKYEAQTDSAWVPFSCNAPRINMDLKSGEKGQTLKDMVLGCAVKKFEKGQAYRIIVDYMLNERVFEENAAKGDMEDNIYVEQKIYSFEDEFTL